MDFRTQLSKAHSKENAILIAEHVGINSKLFTELMELFFDNDIKTAQRAAHAVSHCTDSHPELITPFIGRMINHLETQPHVAIRRNTVRILQHQSIPEAYQGVLVEMCFNYLQSAKETVAVKAFSMTILHNLTKIYPDLIPELSLVIKETMEHATPGIKSRGKKILANLEK